MLLIQRILEYPNKYFNESVYLDEVIATTPQSELFSALEELLMAKDPQILSDTLLFVQDMLLVQPSSERQLLRESYPNSSVVIAIEALLHCTNYAIRRQAVYVLGKTNSYSSISKLEFLFLERRDTDPLLLPRLMGELGWLGSWRFDEFVELMIASPRYLTRWAVLQLLPEFLDLEDSGQFQHKLSWYQQLRQDPHSLVQHEAEYLYQLQEHNYSSSRKLPKATRRQQRKNLEQQYKPSITFEDVSLCFSNYLYSQGWLDYSVEQFEAFILQL